jgi:hypothetical protein
MPGLIDICGVCQQEFLFSLPRCAMCRRAVCSSCGIRVGGAAFCSKACGHSFFYGGELDTEDREEGEFSEDE